MLTLSALVAALLLAAAQQAQPPPAYYQLVEHPIIEPEPAEDELALDPDEEDALALPPPRIRTYDFDAWQGRASNAWSDARPLRRLSVAADDALTTACAGTEAGAAIIDLRSGRRWLGGSAAPRPIRSVVKAPLALAAITQAERDGTLEDPELAEQTRQAVAHGGNDAATALYDQIGGSAGLADLYLTLGLPRLADQLHPWAWGLAQANPADLADLAAAFAASPNISETARQRILALMLETDPRLHWGAISAPENWQLAVRTGLFYEEDAGLHLNSAALWLDPAGAPRYAIAIITHDDHLGRPASWNCQYNVGRAISEALAQRSTIVPLNPWTP